MGIADLHIHSIHSYDSTTTVRAVLRKASELKLDVIAITDHDEIRGSLEARELASQYNLEVVPGVEVSTHEGHLLALFLEKLPPKGLSLIETLVWIGEAGGLAIAPHPFYKMPNCLSMETVIGALKDKRGKLVLQGIELYNMLANAFGTPVRKIANFLPIAQTSSSDSHLYWTVGSGVTEFPGKTAAELRYSIENRKTVAVPIERKDSYSPEDMVGWVRQMTLRKFGYAADSHSASEPVDTQRIRRAKIKKDLKKTDGDG